MSSTLIKFTLVQSVDLFSLFEFLQVGLSITHSVEVCPQVDLSITHSEGDCPQDTAQQNSLLI